MLEHYLPLPPIFQAFFKRRGTFGYLGPENTSNGQLQELFENHIVVLGCKAGKENEQTKNEKCEGGE